MQNKSSRPNVVRATAFTAGTYTSQVETNTWGRGIRLYVTVSAVTSADATDSLFLCGAVPSTGTLIPLAGFSAAGILSTAGTFVFDFYPGAWLPSQVASGGASLGVMGLHLPLQWAVQLTLGTGNAATLQVDAEILP